MKDVTYSELNARGLGFYATLAAIGAVAAIGLAGQVLQMEQARQHHLIILLA